LAASRGTGDHRRRILEYQEKLEAERKPAAKPGDPQLKMPLIGIVRRAEPAPPNNKPQRTKKPIQPKLADL
jgi:hypothetical protein